MGDSCQVSVCYVWMCVCQISVCYVRMCVCQISVLRLDVCGLSDFCVLRLDVCGLSDFGVLRLDVCGLSDLCVLRLDVCVPDCQIIFDTGTLRGFAMLMSFFFYNESQECSGAAVFLQT